jgi:hypothetical protein
VCVTKIFLRVELITSQPIDDATRLSIGLIMLCGEAKIFFNNK